MLRKRSLGEISGLAGIFLFLLRTAVGWHFLYEGISKIFTPNWSSAGFLESSRWLLQDFFHWIAAHPVALNMADMANILGLILIGSALLLGLCVRSASLAGVVLLLLYYMANPPLIGMDSGALAEGSYLVVDKNLVELLALCVLATVPAQSLWGLGGWLHALQTRWRTRRQSEKSAPAENAPQTADPTGRRALLKALPVLPFAGAFAYSLLKKRQWESIEEKNLADMVTGATLKVFNFSSLKDLKGKVPTARIKQAEISRMILGGNLIGGWAHARDLTYVSSLVKKYHTQDKIFETLMIAERCGINTLLTNPLLAGVIKEYWRRNLGKIQYISDLGFSRDAAGFIEGVKRTIDDGAAACYVHGGGADELVAAGKVGDIGQVVEYMQKRGIPGGIGAHRLETITACAEAGIFPDFWMKTFHHHNYWSAKIAERNDSVFCETPDQVINFMNARKEPWIAFKTLAAGAITPAEGFEYALANGADFICVGMYDFQIVDDVNIFLNVLKKDFKRTRPWMA